MSNTGDHLSANNASWSFKGETAEHFDQHISKSVPFYEHGHKLICDLSDYFITAGSTCYELGCSTGTLSTALSRHNAHKAEVQYIAIDIEEDMVKIADNKGKSLNLSNINFCVDDLLTMSFEPADMIIAYYTVQFIHPRQRQDLINRIYQALNWGGAFLYFEKVRANDGRFQDITTSLYNEYKLSQGYTPEEIFSKTRSLKGILEPFSTEGNLDLLKRAGFVDIISVFKYICFEGFLAIK
ncbi:MAG: methyltransferase domain-containing protein [Pseudomonadota bacterium]